jgi:3-hydroxyisobutyrate dehydrogenase
MTTIAFIGLGNMGGPMARNLLKAQHAVRAFDLSRAATDAAKSAGATIAASAREVVQGADVVVSMLPAGAHVRSVYLGTDGVLTTAAKGAVLIDCSTIDVESAKAVHEAAAKAGFDFLDAPVSGGVGGAEAATLTFMCGGTEKAFARAQPVLEKMGKRVVHAGGPGMGQAAKICNNMLLAISMIGTCEAFVLAEKLGLDRAKLFEIASTSSGQCWSLTTYCPVPGPVPTSPANRDYKAGFTVAMMLKDLKLAQNAAMAAGAATPLGGAAEQMYALLAARGHDGLDFSGIIKMIRGDLAPAA